MKVEAANWSEDENPIIQAVISISQKFLDLSTYHNQLKTSYKDVFAKKAFIQAAQGIMIDTTQFVKAIQPVITACTDKRLRLQIQSSAARLTTLSQQLKIVAAVKASSLGDNDAAVQLISCAQNLVGSIKMALRDCVSCSIRARKESNAEIVGIKFRKVVFARNLLPAGFQARIK